jgi:hypothetical protein
MHRLLEETYGKGSTQVSLEGGTVRGQGRSAGKEWFLSTQTDAVWL